MSRKTIKIEHINEENKNEFKDNGLSHGWLVFWIILFWPVAIYYYITKK